MTAKYTGSCACGAVRVEIDADPVMAGHCQCGKCQGLSGAGHSTFAGFPTPAVHVRGAMDSWSYTADSGHTATRSRCKVCGAPVVSGTTGMPGITAVNLPTLDDSTGVTPGIVFFHARAQSWDMLDPALPAFPGMPQM
ncbi:MAG: GFA family protein [Paracoccaceae bacterium]